MPSPPPVPDEDGLLQMDVKVPRWVYDHVHRTRLLKRRRVPHILGELVLDGLRARGITEPSPKTVERL